MTTTHSPTPGTTHAGGGEHAGDRQTFELYGRRITRTNNPDVQQLLAAAHTDRVRPLCMCRPDGVAMYVAKIGPDKYVIKRMPDSGLEHSHRCGSYRPPEELSGLGQVRGSAITEEADIGLTAKYNITPTVTLDFAYNPDFAQVEADATVVTANQRFPIFFEEKRPFFLEGKEIFETLISAVHTRTIVDPDYAAKLSGKQGRTSFGLMFASDNAPGPANPAVPA